MIPWQKTYPTLGTVKVASFGTLETWEKNLPAPQTDVERTIIRRIKKKLFERMAKEVNEKEPHIADMWNDLSDKLKDFDIDMPKM